MKLVLMDDGSIGRDYRFLGVIPVHSDSINAIRLRVQAYKGDTFLHLNDRSVVAQKLVESDLSEEWNAQTAIPGAGRQ